MERIRSQWTDAEITKVITFVGNELKRDLPPREEFYEIRMLQKYRNEKKTHRTIEELSKMVRKSLQNSRHFMNRLDDITIAKVLYFFQIPIGKNLLKQMQDSADVELDQSFIMQGYKSRIMNVRFGKESKLLSADSEPMGEMLQFLASFSEVHRSPVTDDKLAEAYMQSTRKSFNYKSLSDRFRKVVKPAIQTSTQFDLKTRVRMMFVTKTAVGNSFWAKMDKIAEVDLNESSKIVSFTAHDGSLVLDRTQPKRTRPSSSSNSRKERERSLSVPYTPREIKRMRMVEPEPKTRAVLTVESKPKYYARRTGKVITEEKEWLDISSDSEEEKDPINNRKINAKNESKREIDEHSDHIFNDNDSDLISVHTAIETPINQLRGAIAIRKPEIEGIIIPIPKEEYPDADHFPKDLVAPIDRSTSSDLGRASSTHSSIGTHSFTGTNSTNDFSSYVQHLQTFQRLEVASVKDFLKSLRTFVATLGSPRLAPIEMEIRNWIDCVGDHQVPMDDVILSLQTFFRIIINKSSYLQNEDSSIDIQKVLTLLVSVAVNLESSSADNLLNMIRKESEGGKLDSKVAIKYIDLAIGAALGIVTPSWEIA